MAALLQAVPLRLTAWAFPPVVALPLVAIAALAAVAVGPEARRWRRTRGAPARGAWLRPAGWYAGAWLTLVVALCSPIDVLGDTVSLSLHMVQHLLLGVLFPPLALLGLRGTVAARRLGGSRLVRRLERAVCSPWTGGISFAVGFGVWHLPPLYDAALRAPGVHFLEHATFVAVGVWFWWPVVRPLGRAGAGGLTDIGRLGYLAVAGVVPTVIGLILALAPRPLYAFYVHAPHLAGLPPRTDQLWAGLIMFAAGNLFNFAVFSYLFARLMRGADPDEAPGPGAPSEARW